ncbi:hypothetical protein [Chryseolinea lacunae]|uniref:Lipocalin-like domain-containing protein n=1 Tax=Chryseolinea lacunae TaxID=2801331 RepID=A0ABS1L093_9BACT|nr:hypothetical protein [Chryseolinea lacunae]MBL0744923.1 hypothetical protein [Chryseolinea lacunae]
MKKSFYWGLVLAMGLPLVFGSCNKDDDPAPVDSLVGTWKRDVYRLTDLPANFSNFEGTPFTYYYLGSYEEGVTFTFKSDNTYTRNFAVYINPDFSETGKWTHESSKISMKTDDTDFDDEEFTVEGEITADAMTLSKPETYSLLPDAVTDTLTNAWAEAHEEELDKYFQQVNVKLLFVFDKVKTP